MITSRKTLGAGLAALAVLAALVAPTPASGSTDLTPASGSTVGPAPLDTSAFAGRTLRGVTSVSPADAWAVGFTVKDGFTYNTLTEHWDGEAWVKVPSPNPEGESINTLLAVDAVSSDDVWAVGNSGIAETASTIIQHWDGEEWSLFPSPPGELYGVTAVSSDDVWAVGNFYEDFVSYTLIMHWDGNEWTTVESPELAGHLYGVSVVSADDVWVAGFFRTDVNNALVMHWDGASWTQVETPLPGFYSELYGISAISADDVWAVGNFAATDKPQKILRMHWDGSTWAQVKGKLPPGETNPFAFGISAASSSKVWAVGFRLNTNETLAIRWNGTKWAQQETPSPTGQPILWGVEAISANDVWAVGTVNNFDTGGSVSLIEHWDGEAWSIVESP